MSNTTIRVLQVADNPIYAGLERHVDALIEALNDVAGVEPFLAVFNDGPLVEHARALGVSVEVVPLSWVYDVTAIPRLASLMKRWNINLVHSHGYKANAIGVFAARLAGIKAIVCTEHGWIEPFKGFARIKLEAYEALNTWVGNRLAGRIIAVSEDLRRHLVPRYPRTEVTTVHNGIHPIAPRDPQSLKAKRSYLGIDESALLIGIVGRLNPVKNHSSFLRAAAIVHAKRPDSRFIVVGDGPLLDSLRSEAEELGLANIAHFLGFRLDALDWIAALDLLVFSSISEGIPYTLLEAMSLGVPTVATAVGGLPEIIEDGVTGLLVKSSDPMALAQACLELLDSQERRQQMAEASRHRSATYFSDIKMAEAARQVYFEVARQNGVMRETPEPAAPHRKAKVGAMEP